MADIVSFIHQERTRRMKSRNRNLSDYEKKRDFTKTQEPRGGRGWKGSKDPAFVIQKHASRTLHYDFRLEVGGVLVSWAVPKGPSTDPKEKRLAVPTEDHPLEYAGSEGVIPEGEYGAGTVMVWDTGTYTNMRASKEGDGASMARGIEEGKIEIELKGKKLRGGYALVRTGRGDTARWLLIKMRDDDADARRNPVSTEQRSALTGRTMKEIAKGG
jgi:DNA ligase D-like protein (predicted 3'-phosphoesterase)